MSAKSWTNGSDAVPLAPWLEHLERHLPVARAGRDSEGVHQLRVAAARLDVWLRLAGMRVLRDDLRWLRRAAGPVRDLDVLLAGPADAELVQELRQRRERARQALLAELDHPRLAALLRALRLLPPLPRARALAVVARWSERALRQGRALDFASADLDALHELRRRVRRLRFAREWVGLPARRSRRQQDLLGELGDAAVLREHLRARAGKDGAEAAEGLERVDETIANQRARASAAWRGTARELRELR